MYKNGWQTANEYNIWKSNVIKNETTEMARILCNWKYEGIINIALKHRGKNMNKDMVQPKVVKDNKSQFEIQTELMERILDEMISNRDLLETKLNELIDLINKKKRGIK